MGKIGIVISQKPDTNEALKECAITLKYVLKNQKVTLLFVLSTPQYPTHLLQTSLHFLMNVDTYIHISSPLLIYETSIIEQGIILCAFTSESINIEKNIFNTYDNQEIESTLRKKRRPNLIWADIGKEVPIDELFRTLNISLGKFFNLIGIKEVVKREKPSLILHNIWSKLTVESIHIGGFLPVGKFSTISDVNFKEYMITKINTQPASQIYKKYFQDSYSLLTEGNLLKLYPLGIKTKREDFELIRIDRILDDNLIYRGKLKKYPVKTTIMISNTNIIINAINKTFKYLSKNIKDYQVAFVINKILRKDILKNDLNKEIIKLKEFIQTIPLIGVYSEYAVYISADTNDWNWDYYNTNIFFMKTGRDGY